MIVGRNNNKYTIGEQEYEYLADVLDAIRDQPAWIRGDAIQAMCNDRGWVWGQMPKRA